MKVTASAGSLNVEDVAASSRFLQQRFGFAEVMAAGHDLLGRAVGHDHKREYEREVANGPVRDL